VDVVSIKNGSKRTMNLPRRLGPGAYSSIITPGEILAGVGFGPKVESLRFGPREIGSGQNSTTWTPKKQIPADAVTLTRWELAVQFIEENNCLLEQYRRPYRGALRATASAAWHDALTLWEYPNSALKHIFVALRVSHYHSAVLIKGQSSLIPSAVLSLTTALYGGIHFIAWNLYLPTIGQRNIWRLASGHIALSGLLYSLGSWLLVLLSRVQWGRNVIGWLDAPFKRRDQNLAIKLLKLVTILAVFLPVSALFLAYIIARCYMPIEALASLKELPDWTKYIPHL
jgi:hypothetical protein